MEFWVIRWMFNKGGCSNPSTDVTHYQYSALDVQKRNLGHVVYFILDIYRKSFFFFLKTIYIAGNGVGLDNSVLHICIQAS
jgi:hypothetical protein